MRKRFFKGLLHDHRTAYLLLLPFMLLFAVFNAFPIFFSAFLSFQSWNPVKGLSSMKFVGLDNFYYAFTDDAFWVSLVNTIKITLVSGLCQHLFAITLAYSLLHIIVRGRRFLKAAIFLPYITSSVAVSLIVFNLFSPVGMVNELLSGLAAKLHLSSLAAALPINFFDSDWIRFTIANQVTWKFTGINTVIYMTGLASISPDLYEAIELDGAGRWQKFRYIALPLLAPFIFFATLMTLIGNMQLFNEPMILTQGTGGVDNSGLTVSMYVYKTGWSYLDMGTASAISWILFLLIALVSALVFWGFGSRGGLKNDR
ncbi:carbohydrate ABC transporter permease [Serratia quinivorans]|uniref:carbohydrate ABC transporter permease n=1 Tax=Serratia quinivorans TaxID=137545 RepID=UPI003F9DD12F